MAKQNLACPQKFCFLPMKSQYSERYHTPHGYLCQKIEHCPWDSHPLVHLLTSFQLQNENSVSFRTMFWYICPIPSLSSPTFMLSSVICLREGMWVAKTRARKPGYFLAFPYLETLTLRKMEMTHSLGKHLRETIVNKIYLLPGLGVQRRKWVGGRRPQWALEKEQ